MQHSSDSLKGKVVAIPENRQLLLLSSMLRKRGADVMSVPMVSILDAPDPQPVLNWIVDFIQMPPDVLILLTGEGLRRLLKLAESHDLKHDFITALSKVKKLCRGPKPNQALREIGLEREIDALAPTTDGVIASLETMELAAKNVAVQLYGEEPNIKLISYLEQAGACVKSVAPYIYANQLADEKVRDLINKLHNGDVDVIAFSSQPQVKRLFNVAKKFQLESELITGLDICYVAAIGPLVKDALNKKGVNVEIMPQRTFFMKPLVTAIAKYLNKQE